MSGHMVFRVEVTELASGWQVVADDGQGSQAEITAPTCRLALAMAVPFMHAISEPDPVGKLTGLDALEAWPTTVDGPRDMGGQHG